MESSSFRSFWNRVILRKINGRVWVIDPHNSYAYGQKHVITLDMPNYKNYMSSEEIKGDIDYKTMSEIKKEYEKFLLNNKNNFINRSNAFNYSNSYPWKVGIELTTRCNFNCIHCYAEPLRKICEPSFDKLIEIIDKLFDSGVIWLWLTGGECTLRKDFLEIYKYAKQKGFIVTILTNGSLINGEMIDVFKEYPPLVVKLSQYGMSEKSYKIVTGSEKNFHLFVRGLNKLLQNKINVLVQSVITTHNRHELVEMQKFCSRRNIQQNISSTMIPKIDGNAIPLSLEAVDIDLITKRKNGLIKFFSKNLEKTEEIRKDIIKENEFFCGAGINFCFITADLKCIICFLARDYSINLIGNNNNFLSTFMSLSYARKKLLAIPRKCQSCEALIICNFCKVKRELFSIDEADSHNRCEEMQEIYYQLN